MGYDIDRFVSRVNDGLVCCICRDVLEDPVQAAECEHAYCKTCIRGWLVQEHKCPEDRTPLHSSDLRPLFRYMKNDLDSLQIRCRNVSAGCTMVCALENIEQHETQACPYFTQPCPMAGCTRYLGRGELDQHLEHCEFRLKECPQGCGLPILSHDDHSHNCVGELRNTIELLRSEMICKLQDQRQELELRLDTQRRHMVQREQFFRAQVDELKTQVARVMQDVVGIKDAEQRRLEEQQHQHMESQQLMELLLEAKPSIGRQCSSHSDKSIV